MAALVRLLAPLGVAAPAVRTAVSRMVRQGWLEPVRIGGAPGYALTPRAVRRLDEAAARVYRTGQPDWDGHWHLLITGPVPNRSTRERLRAGLSFLGYAPLDDTTWVSPRRSIEVGDLLTTEFVVVESFTARYDGEVHELVRRAWDLAELARAYDRWLSVARGIVATPAGASDEAAFAARSRLVHEWRKFLFRDPGLPRQLLPADWPGQRAAEFFDAESRRLWEPASRFVDSCLKGAYDAYPAESTELEPNEPKEDVGA